MRTDPEVLDRVYTCLTHPEVQESAPGKCPLCGSNLVLDEQAPQPPHQPEA